MAVSVSLEAAKDEGCGREFGGDDEGKQWQRGDNRGRPWRKVLRRRRRKVDTNGLEATTEEGCSGGSGGDDGRRLRKRVQRAQHKKATMEGLKVEEEVVGVWRIESAHVLCRWNIRDIQMFNAQYINVVSENSLGPFPPPIDTLDPPVAAPSHRLCISRPNRIRYDVFLSFRFVNTFRDNDELTASVLRMLLYLRVQDGLGTLSLKMFHKEVEKLINRSSRFMYNQMKRSPTPNQISSDFTKLLNKVYVFKIRVSYWNMDKKYYIFNVNAFTDDEKTIKKISLRLPSGETPNSLNKHNGSRRDVANTSGDIHVNVELILRHTTDDEVSAFQPGSLPSNASRNTSLRKWIGLTPHDKYFDDEGEASRAICRRILYIQGYFLKISIFLEKPHMQKLEPQL